MWELDHKENWALKNWCFSTVVLEKILKSPSDSKEIITVNPKGKQIWIFIGKTDTEAEAPILWPPDAKNWLIGKDPDTGKDWRQEKETTEDEMAGWHHWQWAVFEQTLGERKTEECGVLQSLELQRVGHDLWSEYQQHLCNRIPFINKNEWNISACYNMCEPENYSLQLYKVWHTQKITCSMLHLYKIPRKCKFVETKADQSLSVASSEIMDCTV